MKKYLVRYTESINHDYVVVADSPEEAEHMVSNYTLEEFKSLDVDGNSEWDTRPWSVEEI